MIAFETSFLSTTFHYHFPVVRTHKQVVRARFAITLENPMKIDFGLWLKVKMSSRQVNNMTFQIRCSFFYCVGTKLSFELDLRKTLRHPMNIDFELWPNVNMSCFPEEHKMPHLVVPARLFCTSRENTHNFVDN